MINAECRLESESSVLHPQYYTVISLALQQFSVILSHCGREAYDLSSSIFTKKGPQACIAQQHEKLSFREYRRLVEFESLQGDIHRMRYSRVNHKGRCPYSLQYALSGLQSLWHFLQQSLLRSLRITPQHYARCTILRSLLCL